MENEWTMLKTRTFCCSYVHPGRRLALFGLDIGFHRAIVAAAHNPPLQETHNQYNARLWRARFVSSQRHANREMHMRNHLNNAINNIATALKERAAG